MKKILNLWFWAGVSATLVVTWLLSPYNDNMLLTFFAGIAAGAWSVGIIMYCYGQQVMEYMFKTLCRPAEPVQHEEPKLVDGHEEDDISIEDDPDWWKNDQKRNRMKRKYGL